MTDYHNFTTIDTPLEERRRLHVGDIWNNEIKCNKCGDMIRSKNRHDFVKCSCGSVAVDGGSWYQRLIGEPEDIENHIVPFNQTEDAMFNMR